MVAARRLADGLKADLRAALLAMGDDPAARERLAQGFVARCAPVADADHDDIRAMLTAAERAGSMTLR